MQFVRKKHKRHKPPLTCTTHFRLRQIIGSLIFSIFFYIFPLLMSFLCSLSQLARCVTSRGVRSSAAFHTHLTALRVDAAAASSYIPTYPELKQLKKVLFFPLRFICSDLQVPTTSFKWEVGTACCLLTSIATLYPFHS